MLRTSPSTEEDLALRNNKLNSYLTAFSALVLFATGLVGFGLLGTPNARTVQPQPIPVTTAVISVSPDCIPLSTVDLRQSGVQASAASGTCVLIIDRQKHQFVAVRTESATSYDRTSPENTTDKLVIKVKKSQLGVWINTLPSSAYGTWRCGFDVAPGSVSDDTCDGKPLPAAR